MSHCCHLRDTSERDHNEEHWEQELSASSHGKYFSGHARGPLLLARGACFLTGPSALRWASVAEGRWTPGLGRGLQTNPRISARATRRRKPPRRSEPTE